MSEASKNGNAWRKSEDSENDNSANPTAQFQMNDDNKSQNDNRGEANNSDNQGNGAAKDDNMREEGGRWGPGGNRIKRRRYDDHNYDSKDHMGRGRPIDRFDRRRRFEGRMGGYDMGYNDRMYGDNYGYRGYDEGRYGYGRYNSYRGGDYRRRGEYGGRMGEEDDFYDRRPGMRFRDRYGSRTAVRKDDAPPNTTIAVFNLRRGTTKEEFDELLTKTLKGNLSKEYASKIIIDKHTGRCRGFGFVTFETLEDATKAKELLENAVINDNPVRVAFSIESKKREIMGEEEKRQQDCH